MNLHIVRRKQQDETGMVSIIVTMIIMVLLSLIVLGFAKTSRREQRQGLDRQLVSQATYAAESGINDAQNYLKSGVALGPNASTLCNKYATDAPNSLAAPGLPKGGSKFIYNNTVATSCVLVDNTVADLAYDGVGTDYEVVVPVKSANNANIQSISISWQGDTGGDYSATNCPSTASSSDALFKSADWKCPAGALRVDIVPINTLNRVSLLNNVKSVLLYPVVGPNAVQQGATYGDQIWAHCPNDGTTPRACNVTLGNIGSSPAFYVRVRPIYKTANIDITASTVNGIGTAIRLTGGQAQIDSTGRAGDIVKRLVARVPACAAGFSCGKQPATFALQSTESICKLYSVIPPDSVTGTNDDPNCKL